MTKKQKTILIALITIVALLAEGLTVMYIHMNPGAVLIEPTSANSSAIPVVEVTIPIPPSTEDTPIPTGTPIVEDTIIPVDPYPITATALPGTVPIVATTPTPEPAYVRLPTAAPAVTPVPTVPKGMAFTLSILGKTVNVASNVDADTLEKTPGWLPTSAKPGKEGVCVVYGYRNRNHLLILKEIEIGDEIDVVMPDGKVYTYVVEKTEILETDEAMHISTIEGKHLLLMTCYPFYYTGHAPQKFVATCTMKDSL